VTDLTNSTTGFSNGSSGTADDYTYDANGNMITDLNKAISATPITYNHLNLPVKIQWTSTKKIEYLYNAAGVKVQKKVTDGTSIKTTDYLDGFQYNNNLLEFFPHSEGYVKVTAIGINPNSPNYAYNYVFDYGDHLGNVRVSYTKDPQTGNLKILDEAHYYPFGLKHQKYATLGLIESANQVIVAPIANNPFKYSYNNTEWQNELGWNMYDMDFRQYDPTIGRWVVQDAILHHNMSPYTAFDNNPVFWADPSGMDGEHYNWETGRYEDDKGNEVSFETAMASVGLNPDGSECKGKDCIKTVDPLDYALQNKDKLKWNNESMAVAFSASGVLIADDATGVGVFDDVAIPVILGIGGVWWMVDNSERLMLEHQRINRWLAKNAWGFGMTYALIVNQPGTYIDVRGNSVVLNAGDVWKYGETTKLTENGRYSKSDLDVVVSGGVTLVPLFYGSVPEIKVQEKIMITGHYVATGSLPPGNRIFR